MVMYARHAFTINIIITVLSVLIPVEAWLARLLLQPQTPSVRPDGASAAFFCSDVSSSPRTFRTSLRLKT